MTNTTYYVVCSVPTPGENGELVCTRCKRPLQEGGTRTGYLHKGGHADRKECSKCREILHLDKYHKDTNAFDGYKRICKECDNKMARKRHSRSKKNKVRLSSWIPRDVMRAVDHIVRITGISKTDFIVRAIRAEVERTAARIAQEKARQEVDRIHEKQLSKAAEEVGLNNARYEYVKKTHQEDVAVLHAGNRKPEEIRKS